MNVAIRQPCKRKRTLNGGPYKSPTDEIIEEEKDVDSQSPKSQTEDSPTTVQAVETSAEKPETAAASSGVAITLKTETPNKIITGTIVQKVAKVGTIKANEHLATVQLPIPDFSLNATGRANLNTPPKTVNSVDAPQNVQKTLDDVFGDLPLELQEKLFNVKPLDEIIEVLVGQQRKIDGVRQSTRQDELKLLKTQMPLERTVTLGNDEHAEVQLRTRKVKEATDHWTDRQQRISVDTRKTLVDLMLEKNNQVTEEDAKRLPLGARTFDCLQFVDDSFTKIRSEYYMSKVQILDEGKGELKYIYRMGSKLLQNKYECRILRLICQAYLADLNVEIVERHLYERTNLCRYHINGWIGCFHPNCQYAHPNYLVAILDKYVREQELRNSLTYRGPKEEKSLKTTAMKMMSDLGTKLKMATNYWGIPGIVNLAAKTHYASIKVSDIEQPVHTAGKVIRQYLMGHVDLFDVALGEALSSITTWKETPEDVNKKNTARKKIMHEAVAIQKAYAQQGVQIQMKDLLMKPAFRENPQLTPRELFWYTRLNSWFESKTYQGAHYNISMEGVLAYNDQDIYWPHQVKKLEWINPQGRISVNSQAQIYKQMLDNCAKHKERTGKGLYNGFERKLMETQLNPYKVTRWHSVTSERYEIHNTDDVQGAVEVKACVDADEELRKLNAFMEEQESSYVYDDKIAKIPVVPRLEDKGYVDLSLDSLDQQEYQKKLKWYLGKIQGIYEIMRGQTALWENQREQLNLMKQKFNEKKEQEGTIKAAAERILKRIQDDKIEADDEDYDEEDYEKSPFDYKDMQIIYEKLPVDYQRMMKAKIHKDQKDELMLKGYKRQDYNRCKVTLSSEKKRYVIPDDYMWFASHELDAHPNLKIWLDYGKYYLQKNEESDELEIVPRLQASMNVQLQESINFKVQKQQVAKMVKNVKTMKRWCKMALYASQKMEDSPMKWDDDNKDMVAQVDAMVKSLGKDEAYSIIGVRPVDSSSDC